MYFSKNIPVVINYKIRNNKNRPATRPARYSLAWPDRFSRYYLWWQKNGKTQSELARLHASVAMEKACLVYEIARALNGSVAIGQ